MYQLRDVITHLLRLAGPRGANRTVLTKLVYFAELESWQQFGRPLTGVSFYRFKYGAWAPDVRAVAESVDCIEHSWFSGFYPEHRYRLKPDTQLPSLASEVEDLLVTVCNRLSGMTAADIGMLSKKTAPMLAAFEHGESLDLTVAAPRTHAMKFRNSKLAVAQAELDLSQRGTREEIDRRDEAEIAAWANARRPGVASPA